MKLLGTRESMDQIGKGFLNHRYLEDTNGYSRDTHTTLSLAIMLQIASQFVFKKLGGSRRSVGLCSQDYREVDCQCCVSGNSDGRGSWTSLEVGLGLVRLNMGVIDDKNGVFYSIESNFNRA